MSFSKRKLLSSNKKTDLVDINIEKPKINDCIRIVETVVDFAFGKHNAITNHIYRATNKSMSNHSNRENSSNANEVSNSNSKNKSRQQQYQQVQQQQIDTPPNSPDASDQGSKACCFCWCCCCSCSCLTVRNTENGNSNSNDFRNPTNIDPPSIEEVRSWAESFDNLMQSQSGRLYFREFLRSEYSEENMLFWMACEELKTEPLNPEIIEEKARSIYEDYISILSPKEVSLDSRVREVINKNMVEPTKYTFDEAQLQIFTLMHRDSYPRFLNSPMYRKLCAGETRL